MDWTLEDDMVEGLFFSATLTGCKGGHTPFVQEGAETSDTGVEAVKPDQCSSWDLQHMVNVELIKVDNWLRSNKLSLNYSKSTFMLTKSLQKNSNLSETCSFQIKINDSCFQRTKCAKYLGVLIDSSLEWSSHVQ